MYDCRTEIEPTQPPEAPYNPSIGALSVAFNRVHLAWWGGGQTGYLHCAAKWYVPGPLTLVSTWDGDELSLVRQHHYLRAARQLDIAGASAALERALLGVRSSGLGAYRVIDAGDRAVQLAAQLAERGVSVRRFPGGRLGVAPALDQIEAAAAALGEALRGLA